MPIDPREASKAVLLEVLQALGAFREHLIIVGGAVPDLLLPGRRHVGTLDVDLAIASTAIVPNAYQTICQRLRDAGYSHQINPTRFEKTVAGMETPIKVDLISGQYQTGEKSSQLQVNELALSTLRGLDLAFDAYREVDLAGMTPDGSHNTVRAKIVEPEAFLLIKAFALGERRKPKDAYDIVFVLRHYEPDLAALAGRLRPLLQNGLAREGYQILKSKFASLETIGPHWAAQIYSAQAGEDFSQAQRAAYEFAQELFRLVDAERAP